MAETQESTIGSSQQSTDSLMEANPGIAALAAADAFRNSEVGVIEEAEGAAAVASSNSGSNGESVAENFKVPSPPPSQDSNDKDLLVEAVQSMQQGKRHMIVSDYKSAVPCFEHACQLLDSIYGPGKAESAEAYLHYGISLFELSRLEEGIMDGVVNVENQISSDEEEGDEEQEEEGDEGETPAPDTGDDNEAEAKASSPEEESAQSSDDKVDIDLTQPSTSKGEAASSASGVITSNGDNDEDDDADAPSSVEIAWEVLTMAKDIYEAQTPDLSKENQLNLAEALQKLGEISIEWENNENAIHLLSECLEHRKAALDPDDRLIALTYHFLGIAFSFKNEIDRANSCFESALDVIQMRIKHLKELPTDGMDQFEKDSHEQEISQLNDLIPELTAKIEDIKEQMQSQFKTLESLQKESEKEETKTVQPCADKPVNNISHLIKRKKEADSGDAAAENGNSEGSNGVKKARTEENNAVVESSEATAATN
ncbi:hypothetical protein TYRP_008843 [Tyrophagus putrescentiae]|nr:hypothetical protein TYRP_008843 [Tyrophagus putrescentiae]